MLLFFKVIRQLNCLFCKNNINTKLHSLTPTDNAEKIGAYLKSLKWALLNSKNIKNIAISGPYGAGKSSIIDTYIKKNKFLHKYLKISLANFQDLNVENTPKELERLIELSLLQQFFYHEKDKKIPDSKFQKIRKNTKITLFTFVFLIILFCFSFAYIFGGTKIADLIAKYTPFFDKIKDFADERNYIKTILSFYIIFFACCCIYRIIKLVFNITSMKFSIPHAEIEIGNEISKSALNTYLDEILYFFEVSKYEVVFIEDLDRFEQSDIFVKLRELNQLINNSEKIKQDVVFVYAIKDDMFMNKERTKFFDFIVPVIPVINNSNSKDKLQTILKSSDYEISQDLISDISIFIDDMRLLFNILNEFYLYEQVLSKSDLNENNLLAIITYKNLFPNDFVDLMQNKGILYSAINKKAEYINIRREEIDKQIKDVQEQITNSKNQIQKNIKELRLLYISVAAENLINNNGRYFTTPAGNRLTFSQLTEDEYFELLKSKKLHYWINYSNILFSVDFSVIENQIDTQESYVQKEQNVFNKLNPSQLYKKIEELKNQKEQIQKKTIKELIAANDLDYLDTEIEDAHIDLIYRFLQNGYINENYLDYISIFHEGRLQKSDYDFLLKVKRGISTNPEDKLYAKDELIKQINKFDFEKEAVLNYELIDTLLANESENEKRDILFKQLSKASNKSIDFIDTFVSRTKHLEKFIEQLCSNWNGIWSEISSNSKFSPERKKEWFELIIKYTNLDDINHIFKENDSSISEYEDFFFITKDKERLEQIISILKIKFKKINKDTAKEELDFMFTNCFYELNPTIVEFLISGNMTLKDPYYTSNYKFIMSCEIDSLKKYVNDLINEYITNLYLNIENNTKEELETYVVLLNNASIKINLKEKLIQKVETSVEDIKTIKENDVRDLLFKFKKISISWNNIYENFISHENFFSMALIDYLNNLEVAEQLSTETIPDTEDSEGNGVYEDFIYALLYQETINDDSYALLTKSIPWRYSEFNVEKLSLNRISILIQNNCVSPTPKAFNYLRTNFDGKQIELIKRHPQKLTEKLEELGLSIKEVEKIIELDDITNAIKYSCIKQLSENDISNSIVIARFLVDTFIPNSEFDFSDGIKLSLLLNEEINTAKRINFFKYNHSFLTDDEIDEFIKSLGKEYNEIPNKHKHAEISKNEVNCLLLDLLTEIGYISSKSETKNGYRVNHHTVK